MPVCPNCQLGTTGQFFCPRCGALLLAAAGPLPRAFPLPDGSTLDASGWDGCWPADPTRPLFTTRGGGACRAYALGPEVWPGLAEPVRARAAAALGVLAPLTVVEHEGGAVVVADALPGGGRPLAVPPAGATPLALVEATFAACTLLGEVMRKLHRAGLVWLTFDPLMLERAGTGAARRVANLDLAVYPAGACPDGVPLHPAYAAPEVCAFRAEAVGPATDVYHLGLYAYYALAGLLPDGLPGLGPQAFDFALPALRIYCPELPAGVAPLVARATAPDPAERFATPEDFLLAFARALDSLHRDAARHRPQLRLEHGSATAAGRTHDLRGLPNQDAHAVLPLIDGLLAVVADGVTQVSVGAGELASQLAVESLAAELPASLDAALHHGEALAAVERALRRASEAVVAQTRRLAPAGPVCPSELMCTTAVVGVFRAGGLLLANVGDSRAYLVREGRAELLTVDGDVRSLQLALGAPPEEVLELGAAGASLYTAIGVADIDEAGQLVASAERATPRVGSFALRAGDVVVLCSDGLVEEGAFLEPAELAELVTASASGAGELAAELVAAARRRHRDASEEEPEGFGDDVTCVVVRVR